MFGGAIKRSYPLGDRQEKVIVVGAAEEGWRRDLSRDASVSDFGRGDARQARQRRTSQCRDG